MHIRVSDVEGPIEQPILEVYAHLGIGYTVKWLREPLSVHISRAVTLNRAAECSGRHSIADKCSSPTP